ncbi:MAG: long-chain fatty acid--CoA ligase [Anaerolineae bacterium]
MVTYAERPWLKRYDPGTPTSLEPYPNTTLHQLLRDSAKKHPNNLAIVTQSHIPIFGRPIGGLTYAQLDAQTDALAAALVDKGLKKGDRVAIVMPNTAAFVIAYFAILKAGGIVAATNPTYPPDKMQFQLDDCGAEFVVTLTLFYSMIKGIQARTRVRAVIVTNVKEYFNPITKTLFQLAKEKKMGHALEQLQAGDYWLQDLLKEYAGKKADVDVTGEDVAIFQYTGGTTGISKAAMGQHKAVVANILQSRACLLGGLPGDGSSEVFLGAIPFYHVYGMVTVVGLASALGARIVLVPNARDIDDLVETIDKFKPSIFMGVPALYNAINNHPKVKANQVDVKSIRVCMSGSAPLPPSTKREFETITGGRLMEGYGMSEMPTATHANPYKGENRTGSVGLPFPDVECKIVSLEDGFTEVPTGEIGELLMRGPQLFAGYYNMPEETDHTLRTIDGEKWLYTGDIAKMDEDGYFYLVDRKKDMVLIGGFNVYPVQVDKVLADHPAVLECAVAGVPHDEKPGQEMLKAWIVLHPGMTVTPEELIEHASKRLARYEVPTRYAFIDVLPKSNVGKTLRRELVQQELKARHMERPRDVRLTAS